MSSIFFKHHKTLQSGVATPGPVKESLIAMHLQQHTKSPYGQSKPKHAGNTAATNREAFAIHVTGEDSTSSQIWKQFSSDSSVLQEQAVQQATNSKAPPPAGMRGALSWGIGPNAYEADGRPGTRGTTSMLDMDGRPTTRSGTRSGTRTQQPTSSSSSASATAGSSQRTSRNEFSKLLSQPSSDMSLTLTRTTAQQTLASLDGSPTARRSMAAAMTSLTSVPELPPSMSSKATTLSGYSSETASSAPTSPLKATTRSYPSSPAKGIPDTLGKPIGSRPPIAEDDIDAFLEALSSDGEDEDDPEAGKNLNDLHSYLSALDQAEGQTVAGGAQRSKGAGKKKPHARSNMQSSPYSSRQLSPSKATKSPAGSQYSLAQQETTTFPLAEQQHCALPQQSISSTSMSSMQQQDTTCRTVPSTGADTATKTKMSRAERAAHKALDHILTLAVQQAIVEAAIREAEARDALVNDNLHASSEMVEFTNSSNWQDTAKAYALPLAASDNSEFNFLLAAVNSVSKVPARDLHEQADVSSLQLPEDELSQHQIMVGNKVLQGHGQPAGKVPLRPASGVRSPSSEKLLTTGMGRYGLHRLQPAK